MENAIELLTEDEEITERSIKILEKQVFTKINKV